MHCDNNQNRPRYRIKFIPLEEGDGIGDFTILYPGLLLGRYGGEGGCPLENHRYIDPFLNRRYGHFGQFS